ncbi:MAG: hypothetical protein AAF265_01880 [Pseudomonadota bacterium]
MLDTEVRSVITIPPETAPAVALALSALVFAIAWLGTAVACWRSDRQRRHLPAQAGASASALARVLAGQRRAAILSLTVALTAGSTALIAVGAPTLQAELDMKGLAVIGLIAMSALCLTVAVRRWPRESKAMNDALSRKQVGARLESMCLNGQRLFHDVIPGKGGSIPHVLTTTSGVYAIYTVPHRFNGTDASVQDRDTLLFSTSNAIVDLRAVRSRSAQLQHWIGQMDGVKCRIRSVVAVNRWPADNSTPADILIVNPADVVMLQGWRDSREALMDDELGKIRTTLSAAVSPRFQTWATYRKDALVRRTKRQAASSGSATAANA